MRLLYKDEVREVGRALGLPDQFIGRHPFPGPGLGIRVIGDVTPEKIELLQNADDIFVKELRAAGLYDEVWETATILLPIKAVGIVNGERTYGNVVALRAVTSVDATMAGVAELPYDLLIKVSKRIMGEVDGVSRVVYDISPKPPATIQWE